jgi:DNA-binding winged helix-turn-helix (wHTH) protein
MNIVEFCRNIEKVQMDSWTLYPDRQLLTDNDKIERELEPLLFKMLLYFIEHHERIVTRQELSDEVWQQAYVDDNAINRAISELRKALKSDKQRTQALKTHYRTGYSFSLDVEIIHKKPHLSIKEDTYHSARKPVNTVNIATTKHKPYIKKLLLGLASFALIGIASFMIFKSGTWISADTASHNYYQSYEQAFNEEILTWNKGSVAFPYMSTNKRFLAYAFIAEGEKNAALYIKNMDTLQNIKVSEKSGLNMMPVGWAVDKTTLYFQASRIGENKVCELWSATLAYNGQEFNQEKVWDCDAERRMSVTSTDNTILYSKYDYRDRPYISAIFSKNLTTGTEFQVTSPNIRFSGDYFVKLSSDRQKILFLRSIKNGSAIFMANADGSEQLELIKLGYKITSAVWNATDSHIMWFDKEKESLMSYELATQTISSEHLPVSKSIHDALVVSQNQVVFATELLDSNIYQIDFEQPDITLKPFSVSDEAESLVAPFNHVKGGIYLVDSGKKSLWKVEGEARSKVMDLLSSDVVDIAMSADDMQLLIAYQYKLQVINLNTQDILHELEVPGNISGASWGGSNQIVLTQITDKNDAWIYRIQEGELTRLTVSGIHSARMIDEQNLYLFDQSFKLFKRNLLSGDESLVLDLSHVTHLSWSMNKQYVYYSSGNSINRLDLVTKDVERLLSVKRDTDSFFGIFTGYNTFVYAKRLQNNHLLNVFFE